MRLASKYYKIDPNYFLKKVDPAADTFTFEAEIDLMVYKLYKLSYEEVKIVDPEFGMGEGEYEGYEI